MKVADGCYSFQFLAQFKEKNILFELLSLWTFSSIETKDFGS